MGRIEHHRAADFAQDRQGPHVRHQRIVAEAGPALAGHDIRITRPDHLGDDVLHVPWGQELTLLDIDRLARRRSGQQQVGLTAQEGRDLQHIHRLGGDAAMFLGMDVGQHRQARDLADFGEDGQGAFQTETARSRRRGAVGLVETGLVDDADIQPLADLLQRMGHLQRVLAALQLAGPGNEDDALAATDGDRPLQALGVVDKGVRLGQGGIPGFAAWRRAADAPLMRRSGGVEQ